MSRSGVRAEDWSSGPVSAVLTDGGVQLVVRIVHRLPTSHSCGRFNGASVTTARDRSTSILARALCQTWAGEAEARRRATLLEDAGWRVDWRVPPVRFGPDGPWIVADVSHPDTLTPLGEVSCHQLGGETVSDIIILEDTEWEPSGPGEQLRIQVVWVRHSTDPDWVKVGGWRYGPGDEDVVWAQVQVRATALPGGWR